MKSLILSAFDKANGSARAAYRLHQGLTQVGVESHMLVQDKSTGDTRVHAPRSRLMQGIARARVTIDALPLKWYRHRPASLISLQWLPDTIRTQIQSIQPDVVNLHWANDGFMQIETLAKLQIPVVWSLHDMWAFTGGCHYTQGCDRYLQSCGACPQLGSPSESDLSRWVWHRKQKVFQRARNLTIVTPSRWLADCAQNSSLLQGIRVDVIPNGIDVQTYHPQNMHLARQLLGLPTNKVLILFGALRSTSDKRKGFQYLKSALDELQHSTWRESIELVILGAERPQAPPDLGFPVHYLGSLHDDLSLALVYSSVDLFVAPSQQENLANTVMESLACGTPVVAFKIGGMPDMIDHEQNGYLAQPFDISDLAQGMIRMIEDSERSIQLRSAARKKVEQEFTLGIQAHRYQSLFEQLLEPSTQPFSVVA